MSGAQQVAFDRFDLELALELAVRCHLTERDIYAAKIKARVFYDDFAGRYAAEIRAIFAAAHKHDTKTVVAVVPKTWWDAVKHRWFPSWLLRRFPPAMRQIDATTTTVYHVCPHWQPDFGEREMRRDPTRRHVDFLMSKPTP